MTTFLRHHWHSRSTNRRILTATATVGATTFAVYAATALKEIFVARLFGRGDALEAYLVAFAAQQFLIQVLASSFNPALIPTYIHLREEGRDEEAQRLFASVGAWAGTALLISCITLGIFAGPLFGLFVHRFGPDKIALTASLFTMMLPAIVLRGMGKLWAAVLNSREQFALAAAAPMWTPVFIIVFLFVAGRQSGAYALVEGTVAGAIAEAASLALALWSKHVSLMPRWHGMTPEFRRVMEQYTPMIAGSILMSATVLVDQSMAALLPRGSVATLGYANNITFFIQSVAYVSLSTAVLPFFSQMIARNDWAAISHTLRTWSSLILLVSVPITLGLLLGSGFVVRIAYQRGSFSSADTLEVARVLRFYLLQIPFYVMGSLVVRVISSMRANAVLMWVAAGSLILKFGLNFLLLRYMGVSGIALATSVMYCCSLLATAVILGRMIASRRSLALAHWRRPTLDP